MRIPILNFGMVCPPEESPVRQQLQRFCDAFAFVLGTKVVGVPARNCGHLIDMMRQGKVELAWLPPVVAMNAQHAKLTESLVAMVRRGSTSYRSVFISRASSAILTMSELRDLRVAWTHHESASGYLVPMAAIRASGIPITRAFSEQYFVGRHAEVVKWVREGKADVGATFVHIGEPDGCVIGSSWTEAGLPLEGDFNIVTTSGPIPTDAIAARTTFSPEHTPVLRSALMQVAAQPEFATFRSIFECETFAPCDPSHFDSLHELLRVIERPSMPPSFDG